MLLSYIWAKCSDRKTCLGFHRKIRFWGSKMRFYQMYACSAMQETNLIDFYQTRHKHINPDTISIQITGQSG